MLNLTKQQVASINEMKTQYAAMVADGACIYELLDERRLEGTPLDVIACALVQLDIEAAEEME